MDIPCICPLKEGQPRHDKDSVTLRERLGFEEAMAIQKNVVSLKATDPDASTGDVLATMTVTYVINGIEAWSVIGVDDKPIAPTKPAIRELLLTNLDVAMTVAEAADDLYREAVLAPLVKAASNSSDDTPTESSISPISTFEEQNGNHSSPSSISTTPMDATETTSWSPVGVSSSSPS